jgi:hypothetical protein
MPVARTDDSWIESTAWRWPQPDEADQRAVAREAVAGLFGFLAGWIEPYAIEARVGCYDPEVLGEALAAPPLPSPHLFVVRDPLPAGVGAEGGWTDPVVTRALRLDAASVERWLAAALDQRCAGEQLETSLLELAVRSMAIALPPAWADEAPLLLDDAVANRIPIPVTRHGNTARVAGPVADRVMQPPLGIALANEYRELRLRVQVYWSPWAGEIARPDSELARAGARLEARGWQPDESGAD